MTAQAECKRSM